MSFRIYFACKIFSASVDFQAERSFIEKRVFCFHLKVNEKLIKMEYIDGLSSTSTDMSTCKV